jgi:large subunit ribosomal protein L30
VAEATPRKPAKAGAKKGPRGKAASGQKTLRVKQVRSGIGHAETYRRTLRSLGLRHHQQEIVLHDSPSVRGMLHKVQHLVRVSEEA